jgi:hypothetical protein
MHRLSSHATTAPINRSTHACDHGRIVSYMAVVVACGNASAIRGPRLLCDMPCVAMFPPSRYDHAKSFPSMPLPCRHVVLGHVITVSSCHSRPRPHRAVMSSPCPSQVPGHSRRTRTARDCALPPRPQGRPRGTRDVVCCAQVAWLAQRSSRTLQRAWR